MKTRFAVLVTALFVAGCFGGGQNCSKPGPYQQARPTSPVQAPDGLDALDETRDLRVPVASTPPGAEQGACLERPPAYSEQMATVRKDD